ncbi:MAG TPA: DUF1501 domain-containing protein [Hyphomicrobiaceae bacterium]|nr:DUF1501 domain-containing protein [Hyphomicrobiaceae bacterium]
MDCTESTRLSRRHLLKGGAASLALWGFMPRTALGAARDPRLLTIVLRGGLDGIAMAAPVGDPAYASLRGAIAVPASGTGAGLPLDSLFALNLNMPFLHGLYLKREALIVHAVATPYRGRSHFDGQDVLESGLPGVVRADDGWLNRALAGLPKGDKVAPRKGLSMGAVVPLVIRGGAPVLSWVPKTYNLPLREQTIARLLDLYNVTDPRLSKALTEGLEIDRVATASAAAPAVSPAGSGAMASVAAAPASGARPFAEFIGAAEAAARFLSTADGPRIGALSYNGWDTHANEGVINGLLANRLAGLDAAIKTFAEGMGAAWKETVVVIVTEFGRTARVNGTAGTDHGTATAAVLAGGAVKGGRVVSDWPGLAEKALYEGRDLAPTRDLRGVLKGVLSDHLGIPEGALAKAVFPESGAVKPEAGLIG